MLFFCGIIDLEIFNFVIFGFIKKFKLIKNYKLNRDLSTSSRWHIGQIVISLALAREKSTENWVIKKLEIQSKFKIRNLKQCIFIAKN